jgi:hypothetical protein
MICYIKGVKRKSNIVISVDAEKILDKIQYPFMTKKAEQIKQRRNLPQQNKSHLQ